MKQVKRLICVLLVCALTLGGLGYGYWVEQLETVGTLTLARPVTLEVTGLEPEAPEEQLELEENETPLGAAPTPDSHGSEQDKAGTQFEKTEETERTEEPPESDGTEGGKSPSDIGPDETAQPSGKPDDTPAEAGPQSDTPNDDSDNPDTSQNNEVPSGTA